MFRGTSNFAGLCILLIGCVPQARGPYTAADLAHDAPSQPGEALLRYLAQPGADPQQCGLAVFTHIPMTDIDGIVDALANGVISAETGSACLRVALAHWGALQQRRIVARLADAYLEALHARRAAPSAALLSQLRAALRELLLSSAAVTTHVDALRPVPDVLTGWLSSVGALDAEAAGYAREWLLALELAYGRHQGKPLTPDSIRQLDDATLQLAAAKLPDARLREAARTELLRRRVQRSAFASVRADVDGTVQRVLETGVNALDLARHPIVGLQLDERGLLSRVVVKQDVERGSVLLLAQKGDMQVAELALRDLLSIDALDVSPAIQLCGSREANDPAPCVPARELSFEAPASTVDDMGRLHLQDSLPLDQLLSWVTADPKYTLRVKHGQIESARSVPVYLQPPEPLLLEAAGSGNRGPSLEVKVDERSGYAVFTVSERSGAAPPRVRGQALVELKAPGRFTIVSRGAAGGSGSDGSPGSDGSNGSLGSNASCSFAAGDGSRGSDGGRGGDAGNGQPGGDGGDIQLRVRCAAGSCDELRAFIAARVRSEAGPGGPGGRGGRGGRGGHGGRGGSGTLCSVREPSGSSRLDSRPSGRDGPSGMDGAPGSDGTQGSAGTPGAITVEYIEP